MKWSPPQSMKSSPAQACESYGLLRALCCEPCAESLMAWDMDDSPWGQVCIMVAPLMVAPLMVAPLMVAPLSRVQVEDSEAGGLKRKKSSKR